MCVLCVVCVVVWCLAVHTQMHVAWHSGTPFALTIARTIDALHRESVRATVHFYDQNA